jgi:hypothetical protein
VILLDSTWGGAGACAPVPAAASRRAPLLLLAALVLDARPAPGQLVPLGPEFQVNTYTTGSQRYPTMGADADGNFVVVWHSYAQDGSGAGVFGRRYDRAGTPLGGEFPVNLYTTGDQTRPVVAVASDGRFVVAWESDGQDGSDLGIVARRFDASATPQGGEFLVNTYTPSYQFLPQLAADASGNFVVVWGSPVPGGSGNEVIARRFDAAGTPLGPEFQVNAYTTSEQSPSGLAIDDAGNVIVAWSSIGQDGFGYGAVARRYDASGAPLGPEFVVNTYTTSQQASPVVAAAPDGRFVVAWHGFGQETPSAADAGIFARRFDATGVPSGPELHVNVHTSGVQARATVAMDDAGDFVVAWESAGLDGSADGVGARHFRADGTPDGGEVTANEYVTGSQFFANAVAQGGHDFVVAWMSAGQDGSYHAVVGRRLRPGGEAIAARKVALATPAAGPSAHRLVFLSADAERPTSAGEDPRCAPAGSGSLAAGATLRVIGAGGEFAIPLPCLNWTLNGSGTRYRYRDATGATCRSIVLEQGKLKASCKGPQVAYALGSAQTEVSVVLTTGDAGTRLKQCATFAPGTAVIVRDGSDGRTYRAFDATAGACP